mgnify:CR=1 FL=1
MPWPRSKLYGSCDRYVSVSPAVPTIAMQLHELNPRTARQRTKRVGRGGRRGKTAGRGTKGQRARAGAKVRPAFRDIIKKLPKRRGYRFRSFRPKPAAVSLAAIARRFGAGEIVTPAALLARGLVRRMGGLVLGVKVLGGGSLPKNLTFRGVRLSAAARAAVLAADGRVTEDTS